MKSTNVEMCIEAAANAEAAESLARAALGAAEEREMIARMAFDSTHRASDAEAFTKSVLLAGSAARAHAAALAWLEAARADLVQAHADEEAEREAAETATMVDAASLANYVAAVEPELVNAAQAIVTLLRSFGAVAGHRKMANDKLKLLHSRGKCQNVRSLDGVACSAILLRELNRQNVHIPDLRTLRTIMATETGGTISPAAAVNLLAHVVQSLGFTCRPNDLAAEREAIAVWIGSRDISEALAASSRTRAA